MKSEQVIDCLNDSNTTPETDLKRPSKKTKKRKKDTTLSSQDADEKIAQASAFETPEQPKRKKKKKLKVTASPEDNQRIETNSSGHKDINEIDEQQLNSNKNEGGTSAIKTKKIIHDSEGPATDNKKKKKRKAKKQPTSEMTQITKKKNASGLENSIFKGISDSRLAAYGENPKKLKNKVRYGKQNV